MTLREIYDHLDRISPFELQEGWDNSGILLGYPDAEITTAVLSLDIDEELIESSPEGCLFIVHHPLIFGKLTELDLSRYPANLIAQMIRRGQSLIAMHTNFDRTHLNSYVFRRILGLEPEREEPYLCETSVDWSLEELKERLRAAFGLQQFRMVAPRERIVSVALCTGAGASMMDRVRAECYLTGDIKYHDAVKAMSQGLMMVDIGHWESERFFPEVLAEELKTLSISVIISPSKNPFAVS
ncbi:Nif3-like dinuclear metal center hexameric protein [Nitratifractor sp.]